MKKPNPSQPKADAIAEAHGLDARTVYRHLKKPGAPTLEDGPEVWGEYFARNGVAKAGVGKTKTELQEELLKEQIEKARLQNAQLRAESIPVDKVREFHGKWSTKLDMLLTMKLETEAPAKLVGKGVAEIRAMLRETHDEIRAATEKGLLKWNPTL